jgi:hypothetical protein
MKIKVKTETHLSLEDVHNSDSNITTLLLYLTEKFNVITKKLIYIRVHFIAQITVPDKYLQDHNICRA